MSMSSPLYTKDPSQAAYDCRKNTGTLICVPDTSLFLLQLAKLCHDFSQDRIIYVILQ